MKKPAPWKARGAGPSPRTVGCRRALPGIPGRKLRPHPRHLAVAGGHLGCPPQVAEPGWRRTAPNARAEYAGRSARVKSKRPESLTPAATHLRLSVELLGGS